MKRMIFLFVLVICISSYTLGQVVTLSPDKPKRGDKITVTYNADATGALLKDAKEILLCVNALQPSGMPGISEIKMTKSGNLWKGEYEFSDSLAVILLFRFDTETATDDNNGNTWIALVADSKGEPVEKAHYVMGMLYSGGGISGFPITADKDKSKLEADLEKKLFPPKANSAQGNELNSLYQKYMANKDKKEIVEQVVNDILAYFEKNKSDETKAASTISLLSYMKQSEKADELAAMFVKANPNGPVAKMQRQNKIYGEKDKVKQIAVIQKYLTDMPTLPESEKDQYYYLMMNTNLELKKYDDAFTCVTKMSKPSGSTYNSLAWGPIEKGENLEKAVAWAKKGVELCRIVDVSEKSKYQTTKDFKKSSRTSLAFVLDTYAFGLYQMGKFEEAENNYAEALSLGMKELSDDAHTRYIECLNRNGKYEKAVSFGDECIKQGKVNEKILESYKTASIKANKGTKKQVEKMIADINAAAKKKAMDKISKELVNKPAPQFELKDLQGNMVKLADLKGKIVVVDFWATWCGPCLASFPTLQKVYEKYKSNPDIVILAVNTWENETGKEREKTVSTFIKENKYTFKVLFDIEERAKAFVTQFGVEGIPTKFILDKEGNIQFKSVGFSNEKKMMDEMDAQFEMLLNDGHKTLIKK